MARARARLSLMSILCLLLLAGCGDNANQCLTPNLGTPNGLPPLSSTETIKLAKQATKTLDSPPAIWRLTGPAPGTGGDIVAWPDTPGTIVSSCTVGYDIQNSTCYPTVETYTTSLAPDQQHSGQFVTFSSEWLRTYAANGHHSWQFYVGNDSLVQFLCEQGDPLPPMRG